LGAGQAMMVRSRMIEGRPVSFSAATIALCSASTSSTYPFGVVNSTYWVCQP
jgi:hypothetical protein